MLNIYMLEDNLKELSYFEKIVVRNLFNFNVEAKVKLVTTKPDELKVALDHAPLNNTLFFLDYDLGHSGNSGLDIALTIRARSTTAEIVFISGHSEAALDLVTSEIKPMNFINKGLGGVELDAQIRRDILKCAEQVKSRATDHSSNFVVHQDGNLIAIPLAELIYIQSSKADPGILQVFAQHTTLSYRGSLSKIEKEYPHLLRCHKSFIINPSAVRQFDPHKRLITMVNGADVDVGLRKVSAVRKKVEATSS